MSTDTPGHIEVRGLNEFAYCPRLYYFMYVEGVFVDNAVTISGRHQHDSQEKRMLLRRRGKSVSPGFRITEENSDVKTTVDSRVDPENPFGSIPKNFKFGENKTGLIGVVDAIEPEDNRLYPVESKHGPAPDGSRDFKYDDIVLPGTVWPNDLAQLAGQIYLLRENSIPCDGGYLYYRGSKKRIFVEWSSQISDFLNTIIHKIYSVATGPRPLPLENSHKCVMCSLNEICLPDETWFTIDQNQPEPRGITAPRYDRSVLHIIDSRSKVGVSGENIKISDGEGVITEFHLKDILSLSIYGNAQVTTQAIGACSDRNIPIAYLSSSGRLKGVIQPFSGKNLEYRKIQYNRFNNKDSSLASRTIAAKISNQRTFLRRNSDLPDTVHNTLKEILNKAEECREIGSLLGYEGTAARIYYQNFTGMIHESFRDLFSMEERNKRPPKDPINALLSFAYTMLARDATNACIAVGLDPGLGFFHSEEKGRPALALDLMEPYRPIIADSAVIRAINTGMVQKKDFQITPAGTVMNPNAKKGLIKAYEARADTEITLIIQ